jgi:hypothetical protein
MKIICNYYLNEKIFKQLFHLIDNENYRLI